MKNSQIGNGENVFHIQLLGGFSVRIGDTTIPQDQWKSRRASNLIKLLALAPAHRLHRDKIIETLWPEADLSTASNNFYQRLHGARRILNPLAPDCLRLEDGILSLQAGEGQTLKVDVDQFEAAIRYAQDRKDLDAYQTALAIYRGDLLPDDLYEEFTISRREALRELYVNLLLDLAGLYEGPGEYSQGIETLLRLLSADRSHEEAHTGLMRLYALSGQRQQALRQFQALRVAMQEELDAEPGPEAAGLNEAILSGQFPPAAPASPTQAIPADQLAPGAPPAEVPPRIDEAATVDTAIPNNLPAQFTSFIGRGAEIARVRALLEAHRLVTLTGVGGVGKTQLALQAVQLAAPNRFPAGIWFIDLAPLADPQLVITTAASVLRLAEEPGHPLLDLLITYLKERQALLLLDNCEHLVEACANLAAALLRAAPRLQILATSREPLRVPGEAAFQVPSLSFPQAGRGLTPFAVEDLLEYEAVRLFCDRAQAALPDFQLTVENAAAVVDICRRLDGIPLAIELAAAQVAGLEVTEIAARLDDVFRLLSIGARGVSERQRTLRATIDWSYQLLSPAERALLDRLSVFTGGWTMVDAEAVCPGAAGEGSPSIDSADVLPLLVQLASKSIVFRTEANAARFKQPARYRMLETIRQNARERLNESGEAEYWQDRHLEFFSRFSVDLEKKLATAERFDRLFQQDAELDNMRAAMGWAFAGGWGPRAEAGLWLAGSLYMKWTYGGLIGEGQSWVEKGLALLPKDDLRIGCLRVKTLRVLGHIYCLQYHTAQGLSLIRESIALAPQCGDPLDAAISKYGLAYLLDYFGNDHYEARRLYQETIADYRRLYKVSIADYPWEDAVWMLAVSLNELGLLAIAESDYDRAIILEKESLEKFLECNDRWTAVYPLIYLAAAFALKGDAASARACAEQTLPVLEELKNLPYLLHNSDDGGHRGAVAYYLQDYPLMETIFQRSLAQGEEFGSNFIIDRSLRMLVIANRRQGRTSQAAQFALRALRLQEENKGRYSQLLVITYVAGLALDTGQVRRAAALLGAAEALFEALRKPMMDGWDKLEFNRDVETLRARLGEANFQSTWAEGRALSLEQALQEARAVAEEIVSSSSTA
jgi:predicted ATPase/DNA-binding SARP family transcriptional activator